MNEFQPFSTSPTAAYRVDMAGRTTPFGPHDDAWLAAASALHLAATTEGTSRRQHLFESIGTAIDLMGDERIDEIVNREWQGERCYVEAVMVLADDVHWAGALRLAAVMLDDLARAARDLSTLSRGRILALRARTDWKLGLLDEAAERYAYIATLGRESRSAELETRAAVGFATIAQLRGNFPELRLHAQRAADLAELHGYASAARLAHHGLQIASAKVGDYDNAFVAGWRVVQLSHGDAVLEAEALQNLGQLMLEAGHTSVARASFAAVMTRSAPARILLPALSGLALASAHLRNEAAVEWSVREVWRAQSWTVPRYELAAALLECAVALHRLERGEEANTYRDAASRIASASGFHELVFRAENLTSPRLTHVAAPSLRPQAAAVARELTALEPEQLPAHVWFEGAPA